MPTISKNTTRLCSPSLQLGMQEGLFHVFGGGTPAHHLAMGNLKPFIHTQISETSYKLCLCIWGEYMLSKSFKPSTSHQEHLIILYCHDRIENRTADKIARSIADHFMQMPIVSDHLFRLMLKRLQFTKSKGSYQIPKVL